MENLKHKKFASLDEDRKTDILIIGGGMAGVLCAYFLDQLGINYLLVEARKIGFGITQNTTAKITFQHSLIYDNLIKHFLLSKAQQYLEANRLALKKYKEISRNIDCDFEEKPAFTYSLDDKEKIQNEITALNRLGIDAKFINKTPLPFDVAGAIGLENQAQFHPLKFITKISENLNILENTLVRTIKKNTAITDFGNIYAKKIIIATHFPFLNSRGAYFLKMYQHRSYVVAIENGKQIDGMYVDEAQSGMSFRNYKNLLLIGGGDHRTGKNGSGYRELRNFIEKHYPDAQEKYFWATQDCMTIDSIPYIGQYSHSTPNLFVATGFNKWGMTSSMVSAMILTDLVIEKENKLAEVFSPQRTILKPQLFKNIGETLINFLTPTVKRCSHLGCALKYNKYEHSWDCPCHGSRFDENGKIIDNPAMEDIHV